MRVSLTTETSCPPARTKGRGTPIALCRTWAAYTVRRAIADVAATSDADYRQLGLDKADILAALERLRDELRGPETTRAADARGDGGPPLAIAVPSSHAARR